LRAPGTKKMGGPPPMTIRARPGGQVHKGVERRPENRGLKSGPGPAAPRTAPAGWKMIAAPRRSEVVTMAGIFCSGSCRTALKKQHEVNGPDRDCVADAGWAGLLRGWRRGSRRGGGRRLLKARRSPSPDRQVEEGEPQQRPTAVNPCGRDVAYAPNVPPSWPAKKMYRLPTPTALPISAIESAERTAGSGWLNDRR